MHRGGEGRREHVPTHRTESAQEGLPVTSSRIAPSSTRKGLQLPERKKERGDQERAGRGRGKHKGTRPRDAAYYENDRDSSEEYGEGVGSDRNVHKEEGKCKKRAIEGDEKVQLTSKAIFPNAISL